MARRLNKELCENAIKKIGEKKGVFSAVLSVEKGDKSFSWVGATGSMSVGDQFFIASVTKLYVTTVVLSLIKEGKLNLEDRIVEYLPNYLTHEIHVFNGKDYTSDITVKHLISNTSGIPDYFFHKQSNGKTFASDLLEGRDISWEIEETMNYVRDLTPKFKPGKKNKAAYSDTNYQLLGQIIETITNKSVGEVFQEYIFSKLCLKQTYIYEDVTSKEPIPFYYKNKELWVPNYMASIPAEGGIVSTAEELMLFLRSFFSDVFFKREVINDLKKWNLLMPPPSLFYYGIGLEKLFVPRFISPLKPIKEILGFWGQTGSFAWYNPDTDLYFTGTTNQINGAGHTAAMKAILNIIKAELK
jgi:CubicO group peptidase (beta-lactamase class C family)